MEPWFESHSKPEIFPGHFSSSGMVAFASINLNIFSCYCWTSITMVFIFELSLVLCLDELLRRGGGNLNKFELIWG